MAYCGPVIIRYLSEADGGIKDAEYPRSSLTRALEAFSQDFPRLGPKQVLAALHGEEKKPYSGGDLKRAVAKVFRITQADSHFHTGTAVVSSWEKESFLFDCPRCQEPINLWDYLKIEEVSLYWQIMGALRIHCRQSGVDLGELVKQSLNAAGGLYAEVCQSRVNGDQENLQAAFARFQLGVNQALADLEAEGESKARRVRLLKSRFGFNRARRLILEEIAQSESITTARARQLLQAGLADLHQPRRRRRITGGNLLSALRWAEEQLESVTAEVAYLRSVESASCQAETEL